MDDDADATGEPTSRSYAADDVDDGDDRRNESCGDDALVDIAMVRGRRCARSRRVSGCVDVPAGENLVAIPTVTLVCIGKQYVIMAGADID